MRGGEGYNAFVIWGVYIDLPWLTLLVHFCVLLLLGSLSVCYPLFLIRFQHWDVLSSTYDAGLWVLDWIVQCALQVHLWWPDSFGTIRAFPFSISLICPLYSCSWVLRPLVRFNACSREPCLQSIPNLFRFSQEKPWKDLSLHCAYSFSFFVFVTTGFLVDWWQVFSDFRSDIYQVNCVVCFEDNFDSFS